MADGNDQLSGEGRTRAARFACHAVSAAALLGAGAYLMFGANKGLGIFLLIAAVILSRVLVLNIAMRQP